MAQTITVREIRAKFGQKFQNEVANFSVPLLLDGRFMGSGTLCKCGQKSGILTAHHVIKGKKSVNFDFSEMSKQKLSLVISLSNDRPDRIEIDVNRLRLFEIGQPQCDEMGPDIAFLELPTGSPIKSLIEARKSFFQLDKSTQERLEEAKRDRGLWFLAGFPEKWIISESGDHHWSEIKRYRITNGITFLVNRSEYHGFDLIDVAVSPNRKKIGMPESLGGMSGGGLWKARLVKCEETDGLGVGQLFLAGVIFYESPDLTFIRASGPVSTYEKVVSALSEA